MLDFGNFVRNSFLNKSDYSGLGPRMTKWDGNTMSATESQNVKFSAILTADGLVTAGVVSSVQTTTSFYSVQGPENVARLKAGGTPWPTSPTSAHFGEGLYTWGSRAEAKAYRDLLQKRLPDLRLEIMEFKISKGSFNRLKKFEVPLDDDLANSWLNKHSSLFGSGEPHGFQYIKRNSGMGYEHYFHKSVFNRFKLK